MRTHFMLTVADDIAALGTTLQADVLTWAYAVIGVVLVASAVLWVKRMIGF